VDSTDIVECRPRIAILNWTMVSENGQ
jgi:hypothetical protein